MDWSSTRGILLRVLAHMALTSPIFLSIKCKSQIVHDIYRLVVIKGCKYTRVPVSDVHCLSYCNLPIIIPWIGWYLSTRAFDWSKSSWSFLISEIWTAFGHGFPTGSRYVHKTTCIDNRDYILCLFRSTILIYWCIQANHGDLLFKHIDSGEEFCVNMGFHLRCDFGMFHTTIVWVYSHHPF